MNSLRNYQSQQFDNMRQNVNRMNHIPARRVNWNTNHMNDAQRRAGRNSEARRRQQAGGPLTQQQRNQQAQQQGQQQQQQGQSLQGTVPEPLAEPDPPAVPFFRHIDYRDPTAKLGKPRTLLELWHEYIYGLGPNKPAQDFTPEERGRCSALYSRRKNFWDVMSRMLDRGFNELLAIDKIKAAYGHRSTVTQVINALTKDKREGYNVNLGLSRPARLRNARVLNAAQL